MQQHIKHKIIRFPEVLLRTGYTRSGIYKKILKNTFPRPISLGDRAIGWFESDIDCWLEERVRLSGGTFVSENKNGFKN